MITDTIISIKLNQFISTEKVGGIMKYILFKKINGNSKTAFRKTLSYLSHFIPLEKLLELYFEVMNASSIFFTTYKQRTLTIAQSSNDIPSLENKTERIDLGIILQGPICRSQNFTYLTILRYLHHYPKCHIILSTWKTEKLGKFEKLSEKFPNLHILQLETPENSGPSNINYQIYSTREGLLKVKELGLEYVIKSRTDQCLYDAFALDKLRDAYQRYSTPGEINRITFLALNTFMFRLYGPSDMFQFGKTDQVINYWNVPHDVRENESLQLGLTSLREYSMNELCEVYVCANYLRRLGFQLDFTLKQNLTIFRDLFIILDASYVDLLWNKYTFKDDRWAVQDFPNRSIEWNFALWNNLRENLDYISTFDDFLDEI